MAAPIISFSGLASGIDSAALIQALIDRERAARVNPLEQKITALTDTNSALSELKTRLANLQTAAAKFRLVNGGILSKLGNSSDEIVAGVSVNNSASNGSYQLSVSQLAKNATYSFKSSTGNYTSADDAISAGAVFSDTVSIKIGDSASPLETIEINVDENTTLSDFVTEFNNSSTKAVATLINIGTASSPNYTIVVNTNNSGTAQGEIEVTVGAALAARGAFDNNSVDNAKNALFSIAGIGGNIERATNSISDVIPGLTFELRAAGTTTITISDDAAGTTRSLQDFVDAYNELVSYISENDLVTQEEQGTSVRSIFGPLALTSLDENVLSALRGAFSGASLSGGSVNTLADLGVTTERDGSLKFDEAIFAAALASDPVSVGRISERLGDAIASTSGVMAQFTQFNGLIDTTVKANQNQISEHQKRIGDIERSLAQQEELLNARFSRLEALIGKLQSQQSALLSLLPQN